MIRSFDERHESIWSAAVLSKMNPLINAVQQLFEKLEIKDFQSLRVLDLPKTPVDRELWEILTRGRSSLKVHFSDVYFHDQNVGGAVSTARPADLIGHRYVFLFISVNGLNEEGERVMRHLKFILDTQKPSTSSTLVPFDQIESYSLFQKNPDGNIYLASGHHTMITTEPAANSSIMKNCLLEVTFVGKD